ncbi:UNVERIFIED_CONTAM: hypothetical protein K2H54_029452 [Gekko kuhli]
MDRVGRGCMAWKPSTWCCFLASRLGVGLAECILHASDMLQFPAITEACVRSLHCCYRQAGLAALWVERCLLDMTLAAGSGQEFVAHWAMLAAASGDFHAMFCRALWEVQEEWVWLHSMEAHHFGLNESIVQQITYFKTAWHNISVPSKLS